MRSKRHPHSLQTSTSSSASWLAVRDLPSTRVRATTSLCVLFGRTCLPGVDASLSIARLRRLMRSSTASSRAPTPAPRDARRRAVRPRPPAVPRASTRPRKVPAPRKLGYINNDGDAGPIAAALGSLTTRTVAVTFAKVDLLEFPPGPPHVRVDQGYSNSDRVTVSTERMSFRLDLRWQPHQMHCSVPHSLPHMSHRA
jgi:hypothetical protein